MQEDGAEWKAIGEGGGIAILLSWEKTPPPYNLLAAAPSYLVPFGGGGGVIESIGNLVEVVESLLWILGMGTAFSGSPPPKKKYIKY